MRKFMVLILVLFLGCTSSNSQVEPTKYIDQGDYIVLLKDSIAKLNYSITKANDSIMKINQRIMTADQFLQLYKYDQLNKYYLICVKNPTQWKYYKGWSIRVFKH